jgi:surfeit locus 1 family protein
LHVDTCAALDAHDYRTRPVRGAVSASPLQRLLLLGFGLALSAAFAGLAQWQYQRGETKAQWLMQAERARAASPLPVAEALAVPASPEEFARPVAGMLELRAAPRLLLDNQQREGRVGLREYALARPLDAEASMPWLLLDLGWLPMTPQRALPVLPPLPSRIEARGLLTALPGQGLRMGQNPLDAEGPLLLNYLDPVELGEHFDLHIEPRLLRLDPALPFGHLRDIDLLPNTLPPERHRGYALQWAALSVATLVITFLLWFRSRR